MARLRLKRPSRSRDAEGRMALGDHLRELRNRVTIAAVGLVLGSVVGWIFYDPIYDGLALPFTEYKQSSPDNIVSLNFGNATAAFSLQVQISLFVGVILSSPIWLYQVWAFIVPGLTKKERNVSLAFIGAIFPLFLLGVAFAYFTLPKALGILYGFTPSGASNIQNVADYFAFVTRFILVFGGAFLLPVVQVALNAMGLLPARTMMKAWRPAVFAIFVLAAVITPTPDPFTMCLMAIPLTILFFGAIGVAWLIDRRKARNKPDWSNLSDDEASAL